MEDFSNLNSDEAVKSPEKSAVAICRLTISDSYRDEILKIRLFTVSSTLFSRSGRPFVEFARVVDWERMETVFGKRFCPNRGCLSISTRLMVARHYLKSTHNLSDAEVLRG